MPSEGVNLGVEGWERSPRQHGLRVGIGVMAIATIVAGINLYDDYEPWILPYFFGSILGVFIYVFLKRRREFGESWTMVYKVFPDIDEGATDAIGDLLMEEGTTYSRKGPVRMKGPSMITIEDVFEMEDLRIMVAMEGTPVIYLGPVPYLGSQRARGTMRLIDRALG
jgi:hypothetical protein